MQLYYSKFINISIEDDVLVQQWSDEKLTPEDFTKELCHFLAIYKQEKATNLLWDNYNCQLIIPESLNKWIEEDILTPIYQKGIRNMSFTIPQITTVHLSILKSLEKSKPMISQLFFAEKGDALSFLKNQNIVQPPPSFACDFNQELKSFDVNLQVSPNDLPKVIRFLKELEVENKFIEKQKEKFETLTFRELEVFTLIAKGLTNKLIASQLFIEESSVKTHRKNIKQKLEIKSAYDIYRYAKSFSIFDA